MGPLFEHETSNDERQPRQNLLQPFKELLPSGMRAAKRLLLIGTEADLLHAQARAGAGRCERKRHHALQTERRVVVFEIPRVGQLLVRLDHQNLAVDHATPIAAQIESAAYGWR